MIKQVIDYLKSEARKTMVLSVSGAIITLCGFAWNYVVNRLNAMQQTINDIALAVSDQMKKDGFLIK